MGKILLATAGFKDGSGCDPRNASPVWKLQKTWKPTKGNIALLTP